MAAGLFAARRSELVRLGRHDVVRWESAEGPRLTPLAAEPGDDERRLDGVVFHMSRCGSTVLAHLLATIADTCVLREPAVVNAVLGSGGPGTTTLLRRLVATCRVEQGPAPTAVVLKCSSWNVLHAGVLLGAFPGTPVAFVVRDPLEVLVSLVEAPAAWSTLQPGTGPEVGAAIAVAAYLDAAALAVDDRWLLVRYEELPVVAARTARHFGLGDPDDEGAAAVMRFDVKRPGRPWCADGVAKRARASAALRTADEAHTRPAYDRLLAAVAARVPAP